MRVLLQWVECVRVLLQWVECVRVLLQCVERSGQCGEEHGLLPLLDIEVRFLGCPPHKLLLHGLSGGYITVTARAEKTSEAYIRFFFLVVIYVVKVDICSMRCPDLTLATFRFVFLYQPLHFCRLLYYKK